MTDQIIVLNGRFAPNGTVVELSERPASLTTQEWFNFLSDRASESYRTLSGARIVFRLTRERLDALKREAAPAAA